MTQPCRKNPHKVRQETHTEINWTRRVNDFGKCIHWASLNSNSPWMIRCFRKERENSQHSSRHPSPSARPWVWVGRGEQGSSGTGRGAERSPAELNCAEPARPGHVRGAGNTPALSREGESDKDSCGGERSQEAKNLEKVWGLGFSPPVEKKKSHLWGLLKGPPCWIN